MSTAAQTPAELIRQLDRDLSLLTALFDQVPDDAMRWRPAPERWSMLEVLSHLCDEEREDFRQRVRLTLEDPGQAWPPIDPVGWVTARDYQTREPAAMVEEFRSERTASVAWLRTLDAPDWRRAHQHPKLGELRAGDLLASWVTHDWFHVRQLGGLRVQYLAAHVSPFSTRYADA